LWYKVYRSRKEAFCLAWPHAFHLLQWDGRLQQLLLFAASSGRLRHCAVGNMGYGEFWGRDSTPGQSDVPAHDGCTLGARHDISHLLGSYKLGQLDPAVKKKLPGRKAPVHIHVASSEHSSKPAKEWLLVEWPEGGEAPTKYWLSTLQSNTFYAPLCAKSRHQVSCIKWRWEARRLANGFVLNPLHQGRRFRQ
jgi:hypothetical protein